MTSLSLCIRGTGKKLRRAWIGNSNGTFGIWLRVQSSRLRRGCRNLIARFSLQASLADENAGGPNFKASTCMQLSHWSIHGWVARGSGVGRVGLGTPRPTEVSSEAGRGH